MLKRLHTGREKLLEKIEKVPHLRDIPANIRKYYTRPKMACLVVRRGKSAEKQRKPAKKWRK